MLPVSNGVFSDSSFPLSEAKDQVSHAAVTFSGALIIEHGRYQLGIRLKGNEEKASKFSETKILLDIFLLLIGYSQKRRPSAAIFA